MKKLICTLLTICLLCGLCTPIGLANENEYVEISFRVGDSTLKINGEDVLVETPYVVGDGVTLVPLRVITEAFGATVGWEGETQTITLDYPGVNIILQIGNPIAEVNGRLETLLAAPELPNSSTMVPLRFISETFGATVSYDEATESILVIKQAASEGSTVVSGIDSKYIGDSYYGWTMENPSDLQMEERSFDGLVTGFVGGENTAILLTVAFIYDKYDLTRDFEDAKKLLADYTLVMAEKYTDTNSMHLQGRSKTEFIDIYRYATDKYCFSLLGAFPNDDKATRDEMVRIMSTFTPTYTEGEQIHDLSTVDGQWRKLTDETHNLSMKIPADYIMLNSSAAENEYVFFKADDDDILSGLTLGIYSKSDTITAQLLGLNDYTILKKNLNEKLATFSAFNQGTYGDVNTYEFTITISGSLHDNSYMKQYFWEVGDYVYNLSVTLATPFTNPAEYANEIMSSIEAQPIDKEEVGTLLRNDPEIKGTFTSSPDSKDWTLTVTNTFEEVSAPKKTSAAYSFKNGNAILYYDISSATEASTKNALNFLTSNEKNMGKTYKGVTTTVKADEKRLGTKYYAYDEVSYIDEGNRYYMRRYIFAARGNEYHQFTLYMDEIYRSSGIIEDVEAIISSLEL